MFEGLEEQGELVTELMTKVFVEQPQLHRVRLKLRWSKAGLLGIMEPSRVLVTLMMSLQGVPFLIRTN